MLFLKRFLTTIVFFPILTVFFWFGALVVGGALAGGKAAAEQHAQGYEAGQTIGRQAGEEFSRKYSVIILKAAALGSLMISAGISFSGMLPWCRQESLPPPRY